jgi:hypothetical protein
VAAIKVMKEALKGITQEELQASEQLLKKMFANLL